MNNLNLLYTEDCKLFTLNATKNWAGALTTRLVMRISDETPSNFLKLILALQTTNSIAKYMRTREKNGITV